MPEESVKECECCGFEDPVGGLKNYPEPTYKDYVEIMVPYYLCDLCASTLISRLVKYGRHREELQSLAYIGNQLRKDIVNARQ